MYSKAICAIGVLLMGLVASDCLRAADTIDGVARFVVDGSTVHVGKEYRALFGVDLLAGIEPTGARLEELDVHVGDTFTVADKSGPHRSYKVVGITGSAAQVEASEWIRFGRPGAERSPAQLQQVPSYGEREADVATRNKMVTLARKREEAPFAADNIETDRWLGKWTVLLVDSCSKAVDAGMQRPFQYAVDVMMQSDFGESAFTIEHPERARDADAVHVAGAESALRYYRNLRASGKEGTRSAMLDELLDMQASGKLAQVVSKRCSP